MADLAELSTVTSPLFETLACDDAFNAEDLATYRTQGYVVVPALLTSEQLTALREAVDSILADGHVGQEFWIEYNAPRDGERAVLQAIGAWRVRPAFHDLVFSHGLKTRLHQLIDSPPRLLFDQVLYKPPVHGGSFSWHQDYAYWTYTQPMAHTTCWIALDDATPENGCLQYVAGSHAWGLLPRPDSLMNESISSVQAVLGPAQLEAFRPDSVPVPAGAAIFHHPLVVHGSPPNTSSRPRRALTLHIMADGTRAAIDEPDIGGMPAWLASGSAGPTYDLGVGPSGPPLDGRYFPLVGGAASPAPAPVGS